MDRTGILITLMTDHSLSVAQAADLCNVGEADVLMWLDGGDFPIPKDKLCMLTNIEHLQEKRGMTDAQVAALAGMPVEYVAVWKAGSLPVPTAVMIKLMAGM